MMMDEKWRCTLASPGEPWLAWPGLTWAGQVWSGLPFPSLAWAAKHAANPQEI